MVPLCLVSEETLKNTPPEVRAYLLQLRRRLIQREQTDPQRRIAELEVENRRLLTQLQDLQAALDEQKGQADQLRGQLAEAADKLRADSTNSSFPPSSDRFRAKRRPPPPADAPRKKRGGQRGHPRHERPLFPDDPIDRHVPCKPDACRRCGRPLQGDDPNPARHRVAELPVVRPEIVEYHLHRLSCPCCHTSTRGRLPEGVRGHYGPRLTAAVGLLAGRYRIGVRGAVSVARELWGLRLSPGMVCKMRRQVGDALLPPYLEVALHVRGRNVNVDETPWREGKRKVYLWGAATPAATLDKIAAGRSAAEAQALLGEDYAHVATCDRLKSYWWIQRIQWCWAHLRRDFQAMIDRDNAGRPVGERLLAASNRLFHRWHRVKAGSLTRAGFARAIGPVRAEVSQALADGVGCGCAKAAGTCRELLSREGWLWTFVREEGVEPTNNEGEREERQGVLWRKTSGGTDSASGSRFVERVLTVIRTCLRQGRGVRDYLRECVVAFREGRYPSRLVSDSS